MSTFTWLYVLTIIWLLIFILLRNNRELERRGIYVGPFYVFMKTTRLNSFIARVSNKWPLFWHILLDIGIAMGFGQLLFSIYWLFKNLIAFLRHPAVASPVYPIIPGITIDVRFFVKYIIPVLILVAFTHELAHGIASILAKVPIRSVGVIVVFCLLGAFVEPDEELLNKSRIRDKLRVFAAGSLVNLITALLFLALISSLFYSNPQGILVVDTIPGYPAHGVIPKYSVIMELNGTKILSISDLTNFMRSAKPGDLVMVKYIDPNGDLREAALRLKADIKNKTRPMMGVNIVNFFKSRIDLSIRSSYELWNFLLTTHIISLSVAIFNMLPIYPFDGARFLFSLLERGIKKTHLLKIIKVCIMTVAVILLALNIAFTFM